MLTIIVNTVAGHGRALRVSKLVKASLQRQGIAHTFAYTQYPGHATELARACAEGGERRILCIGGDGTAFEVANGLLGSNVALGILPGGTGNDFARSLGLPKAPEAALAVLLQAPVRDVNVCHLNDQIFLNVCGAGFDVKVVVACNRAKRFIRGMLPYLYGVLHTIFTYQPIDFHIEIDGEAQDQPLLLVSVANGQYIGGGMHIAPMARLDDDLLDIIMIKPVPRWRIPFLLPKFIDGSFIKLEHLVEHRRCRTVRITAPANQMQVDGEVCAIADARLSIDGQKLKLLMP